MPNSNVTGYQFVAPLSSARYNALKGRNTLSESELNEATPQTQLLYNAFGITGKTQEQELRDRAANCTAERPLLLSEEIVRQCKDVYKKDYLRYRHSMTSDQQREWAPNPTRPHRLWRERQTDDFYEELCALQLAVDHYDHLYANSTTTGSATSRNEEFGLYVFDPVVIAISEKVRGTGLHEVLAAGIRKSLSKGVLHTIVNAKGLGEIQDYDVFRYASHPPYVRVALTGRGVHDASVTMSDAVREKKLSVVKSLIGESVASALFHKVNTAHVFDPNAGCGDTSVKDGKCVEHPELQGSSSILEIWPSQHYSPIHTHGNTSGIVFAVYGKLHVGLYDSLAWHDGSKDAGVRGLVDVASGDCAWLNRYNYQCHKVLGSYSDVPGAFSASFHAYVNETERHAPEGGDHPNFISMLYFTEDERAIIVPPPPEKPLLAQSNNRDVFDAVDEYLPHDLISFPTNSDLQWDLLLDEILDQLVAYDPKTDVATATCELQDAAAAAVRAPLRQGQGLRSQHRAPSIIASFIDDWSRRFDYTRSLVQVQTTV